MLTTRFDANIVSQVYRENVGDKRTYRRSKRNVWFDWVEGVDDTALAARVTQNENDIEALPTQGDVDQAQADAEAYADANDAVNDADADPTNELQDLDDVLLRQPGQTTNLNITTTATLSGGRLRAAAPTAYGVPNRRAWYTSAGEVVDGPSGLHEEISMVSNSYAVPDDTNWVTIPEFGIRVDSGFVYSFETSLNYIVDEGVGIEIRLLNGDSITDPVATSNGLWGVQNNGEFSQEIDGVVALPYSATPNRLYHATVSGIFSHTDSASFDVQVQVRCQQGGVEPFGVLMYGSTLKTIRKPK